MSQDDERVEGVQQPTGGEEPASAPVPPPSTQPVGTDNSEERTMALLAHLLGIVTGFLGPLIIFLVVTDKPYAKAQAKEALNFQITMLIGWIIGGVLSIIVIGFLVMAAVGIYALIMAIIATMAASRGEDYRYPIALRLVK